jgi:8-oxo-dGTP diphosphatase
MDTINGGVLLICEKTGNFLLGKRAETLPYGGCWSLFGGKIDEGEEPIDGVKRELFEETQIKSDKIKYKLFEIQNYLDEPFYFYIGYCKNEYKPILNDENSDYGWFDINNLPKPLFPLLNSSLIKIFYLYL